MNTTSHEGARATLDLSEQLKEESVDYFVSFVQMFGLPKSIGQIYGLLFIAQDPLPMDEVIDQLRISKGSASQGLALLKSLGAVTTHQVEGDRRDHYRADLHVSRIVTHFFENRLEERLENSEERIKRMLKLARAVERENDRTPGPQVLHRIKALQKWQKRGKNLLPLIVRWLKR
jgi:DNA-binding transcriptional regulator GbsR (MarR family)